MDQFLLFPLILRLPEASNVSIPSRIVRGVATTMKDPETVNRILWQYKVWKFVVEMTDGCLACGRHLPHTSRSTTTTCSKRCYKIVKRHDVPPMTKLKKEAKERVDAITNMAISSETGLDKDYPWHQIVDGWKYALYD